MRGVDADWAGRGLLGGAYLSVGLAVLVLVALYLQTQETGADDIPATIAAALVVTLSVGATISAQSYARHRRNRVRAAVLTIGAVVAALAALGLFWPEDVTLLEEDASRPHPARAAVDPRPALRVGADALLNLDPPGRG